MAKIILDNGKEIYASPIYLRDLGKDKQDSAWHGKEVDEIIEKAEEDGGDVVVGFSLPTEDYFVD